jgi:hypothetical protein
MIKLLIIPVLTIISLFAFKQGFTQVSSTNTPTPGDPSYNRKQEVGETGISTDGTGISIESGNTGQTENNEQYKEEGNTNSEKREDQTRPTYKQENTTPKTDNDGDTNKYQNYESKTNYEKKIYKSDDGLHKGWYKKGKHKGRQ